LDNDFTDNDRLQNPAATPPVEPRPIRVLVLDDEEALRDVVSHALSLSGCTVETACEGGEGLQLLLSRNFDVVVTDLMMEPMDGLTFLAEALRIWPWLGVVVFSGFIQGSVREQAKELGIETILQKPISYKLLVASVLEEAARMRQRVESAEHAPFAYVQYHLSAIRDITKTAIESPNLKEALRNMATSFGNVFSATATGILSLEESEAVLVVSIKEPLPQTFVDAMEQSVRERYNLLTGHAIDLDIAIEVQGSAIDETSDRAVPTNFFGVPIISSGEIRGILVLALGEGYQHTTAEMSFIYHAANHLSTVLTAFHRIRMQAVHDELTGLYNRRRLEEELQSIWDIGRRYGFSAGVMIFDIDHFKHINDTYGHPVGDQVLRELSVLAREVCRASDTIARYGGDEFVMALPDTQPADLDALGARLLSKVREHLFCAETHKIRCTVSVGAACSNHAEHQAETHDDVLGHADQALYISKRKGRNQSTIWGQAAAREAQQHSDKVTNETDLMPLISGERPEHKGRVLVVDDEISVRLLLSAMVEALGYHVEVVETGEEATVMLQMADPPFDAVLIDLNLSDMSGLDLLERIDRFDIPVAKVVVTGEATLDNAVKSMRMGAHDFLEKPIQLEHLTMTLVHAIEYRRLQAENLQYQTHLEELVRLKSRELESSLARTRDSFEFTLQALAATLDARECSTGQHSQRVQTITRLLASLMGVGDEQLIAIEHGALLHDIGKIGIPDRILLKEAALNEEEWAVMRTHPTIAYEILRDCPDLAEAAKVVHSHHEKFDGTGYPNGLAGDKIPQGARIFTVVDAYDAMRSDRPYHASASSEWACKEISEGSGTQFDPAVVTAFLAHVDKIEELGRWRPKG
jgi:putative two-component system response regulator